MSKQKILHILYSGLGGTTDYVFNLINGDKNTRFEHHILFYGVEKTPLAQLNLAEEIAKSVIYIQKQQGYDKKAYQNVLSNIKSIKPASITLHVNSLILTCAKYKQAKLVFVEHQANHLKTKKEWLWSIIAQKRATSVVCLTHTYQTELKSKLKILFNSRKNTIIHTGIDLSKYNFPNTDQSGKLTIGMMSRINKFRDHKTLINAVDQLNLKQIELHIAGDGPLLSQLKNLTSSEQIVFHGNIEQKKIPRFLSKLNIYCQASFGETSSIALMQAQASGLPIIASNVRGINNVLNPEYCLFVEPKNVNSYKKAIKTLIKNQNLRKKLAENSLHYAKNNLSHFRMFDEYKSIL